MSKHESLYESSRHPARSFEDILASDAVRAPDFYREGDIRTRSNGTTFVTKADLYEIENKDLFPVNSLNDIKRVGYPSSA